MDSELQIGLIALGVAAVVGILAYNKWQERKHRKLAETTFRSDHPDVLLGAAPRNRMEPSLDDDEPDQRDEIVREVEPDFEDVAPVVADTPEPVFHEEMHPSGRHALPPMPKELDPTVDCIISIEAIEPLDIGRLWSTQSEQLRDLSKAVRWFGFDDADNHWHALTPHSVGDFHWLCVALQMVDRRGAIDENEFRSFTEGVQRVADQFLAVPANVPSRAAALANAADTDALCASVDVQVGINLVAPRAPFPGARIRTLAESCGMHLADDGSFHSSDAEGRPLFMLSNHETELFDVSSMDELYTHGMTFLLDVPLVANGASVFDSMMRIAEVMAESLDGEIVDDNRAPFGHEEASVIRRQIQRIHAQMEEGGIPPGSRLATRLFSA